jgi:serine/threonine protein kinase
MGIVHAAHHLQLDERVALKVLRANMATDAEAVKRFAREAKAAAKIKNEHVARVFDVGVLPDNRPYIVMEYLEGEDLGSWLAARGALPFDEAIEFILQACEALAEAHSIGIVHRDLKPSNVMVCDGRAKVIDFGIALLAGMPRLTSTAKVIGTPAYMSPEQLEGKNVDQRSDLYSAALVLYRMLTGIDAFVPKEYVAQMYERLIGPRDAKSIVPALPAGVCHAMAKAMSHDPANRFRSAAAFREALRDGAEGFLHVLIPADDVLPMEHVPAPLPPRVSQPKTLFWRWVSVVAAASALGVAFAAWQVLKAPPPAHPPQLVNRVEPVYPQPPIILAEIPIVAISRPTVKPDPPVAPPVVRPPEETEAQRAERRRRELDALEKELAAAFPPIEADIRQGNFRSATQELDDIASRVRPHAAELPQAASEIERLRDAVRNAEADKGWRAQQDALWESRLNDIRSAVQAGEFGEAQGTAARYLKLADIPAPIAARMQQLLQQAREGMPKSWQSTTVSTTTNTVRKPSSPPRK